MSDVISHKGRIVGITPELTSVEIISESACASCHARGFCGLGSAKTKLVELPTRGWDSYSVGDEVEVELKASMGHRAVWIAYVVPFAILMVLLLSLNLSGAGELASGLAAIGGVCVYYLLVWLLRDRLRKEYIFNIKR